MKSFVANVFILLRGTAIAQVVLILMMPVLARLYPPQAFGILQAIQSNLALLLVLSSLRLELAAFDAADRDIRDLLRACLAIGVLVHICVLIAVAAVSVSHDIRITRLFPALWVAPATGLMAGWGLLYSYYVLRVKDFRLSANAKIFQTISYVIVCLGAAYVSPTALGLAIGDLAGKAVYFLALFRGKGEMLRGSATTIGTAMKSTFQRNRSLTLIAMPSALLSVLGSTYTPLLMLMVFNASIAGQYALVERVVAGPIAMVSGAASQVFMAGFSESMRHNPAGIQSMFRDVVRRQALIGFLPAIALGVLAPRIFPLIFGAVWQSAGQFTRALTPLLFFSWVMTPVNMVLLVAGHRRADFMFTCGRLIATASMWYAIHMLRLSPVDALWLNSAIGTATLVAFLAIADSALGRDAARPIPALLPT